MVYVNSVVNFYIFGVFGCKCSFCKCFDWLRKLRICCFKCGIFFFYGVGMKIKNNFLVN